MQVCISYRAWPEMGKHYLEIKQIPRLLTSHIPKDAFTTTMQFLLRSLHHGLPERKKDNDAHAYLGYLTSKFAKQYHTIF